MKTSKSSLNVLEDFYYDLDYNDSESPVLLRSPSCPHHSSWDTEYIALKPNAADQKPSAVEKAVPKFYLPSSTAQCSTDEVNDEWSVPESYMKLNVLGSGSFGTVYKCYDRLADREFVSKETSTRSATNREVAHSEIELLKELKHPNIVFYYGSKVTKEAIIMYMEFMKAGSLLTVIKQNGPLAEKATIKYIRHVLEGLSYIHSKGIVHIDLKCDNLLLDDKGNVKITDFGSAVKKSKHSESQYFCPSDAQFGVSLYWSAPEILNHEEFDQSADIWSLGCTIVEMLTGEPPYWHLFENEFLASVEARILFYDPNTLVPHSSTAMKLFLSFLLQNDKKKRVQTGSDGKTKLKQIFHE